LIATTKIVLVAATKIFGCYNQNIWLLQPQYLVATTKIFGCYNHNIWLLQPKYLVATTKIFGYHKKMVATAKNFGWVYMKMVPWLLQPSPILCGL